MARLTSTRVVVAGGSGFSGRHVVAALGTPGWTASGDCHARLRRTSDWYRAEREVPA